MVVHDILANDDESSTPDEWDAAAVVTVIIAAFILVLIVAAVVFGYRKRLHRFRCMTARHTATSPFVPAVGLLVYRALVALFAFSVLLYQFIDTAVGGENPLLIYSYYTVWNFTLLFVYFATASIWTVLHMRRATSDTLTLYLGNFLVVAFNVELACVFLVDSVTWCILFPGAVASGNTSMLVNFESITEHGLNGVFMLIEFSLNHIPIVPFHAAHMMVWAGTYMCFSWVFYVATGIWRYDFLNIFSPWSPFWYTLVAGAHIVYFFILYGVHLLKLKGLLHYGFEIVEEKPVGLEEDDEGGSAVYGAPSVSYSSVA
eukprot:TRINITY_DN4143_c1_g1_i1.p1 TRINITY_DN4143_c1_g1~~TRINITY_DN4143_c1_g1_i1.p1  ORF type:complete len:355 (-),score=102.01 TRINITY_DN4143_c1_g1_i1:88-1035(-)